MQDNTLSGKFLNIYNEICKYIIKSLNTSRPYREEFIDELSKKD